VVSGTQRRPGETLPLMLRRRLSSRAVEGFFGGLSRLGRLHPKAAPEQHGVEVLRDIPFTTVGDQTLRLDIYRPRSRPEPLPLCLYMHGGGFRMLSKESHWLMGLIFARRGYVCVVPDYRLAPRHPFPAAIEDAASALCFAAQRGVGYGGDPARLVLAGESAGANLACALAVACCFRRDVALAEAVFELDLTPRALVPLCGVLQASDSKRFARQGKLSWLVADELCTLSDDYLPGFDSLRPAERDLADPLLLLEREEAPARPLPPCVASVGTRDVLIDDTRRLEAALGRRSVRCDARYYPGEMHAFQALLFRAAARESWRVTFDFLAEVLEHDWTPPDSDPFAARAREGQA